MGDAEEDYGYLSEADVDYYKGQINKIWGKEIFKKLSYTMEGKILGITKDTIKSGPNIGKTYYKVKVEDIEGEQSTLSAWEYSAIESVNVGDDVQIDYGTSKDGKYKHINSAIQITQVDERPTQKAIETPAPARTKVYDPKTKTLDEGCFIHRTSALYNAV